MAIASLTPTAHPAFDAVIWDYDGTLVATRAADEWAVQVLLERDPGAASGVELFWATEGRPIEERVELAWPGRLADFLPLFENDIHPRPFRGIAAALTDLRRRGYRLGVVSSRRRRTLEWGLDVTGLGRHFDVVVGLDNVIEPKPSPEGVLRALRSLEVMPHRAVYVGDSEVDILAGRRAGAAAWRATWALSSFDNNLEATLLAAPRQVLELVESPAR